MHRKSLAYVALALAAAGTLQGQTRVDVFEQSCAFGPRYCYEYDFSGVDVSITAIYLDFGYADTFGATGFKTQPFGYLAGSLQFGFPGWTAVPYNKSVSDLELIPSSPANYVAEGGSFTFNSRYFPLAGPYSAKICVETVGGPPCVGPGNFINGSFITGPAFPGGPPAETPEPGYLGALGVGVGIVLSAAIWRKRAFRV